MSAASRRGAARRRRELDGRRCSARRPPSWARDVHRRRADRPLEHRYGHLFEQTIATGVVLTDEHDPSPGWLPTARGGALSVGGGLSLRSAGYLGWRMPTLNELFRPFRAGADATAANPDLEPEQLAGAEAGPDYTIGPFGYVTGFVNRLKDAIANVTLGEGPGIFPGGRLRRRRRDLQPAAERRRGERPRHRGSIGWDDGPWHHGAGPSLTYARVNDRGSATSLDGFGPRRRRVLRHVGVGWQEGGKGAQLVVRRVGAQFDDDLNTDLLKAATTLDASAAWPLSQRLQLVARAENITNALVMAGINGDGSVERATPRTLWLGLRLR